MAVKKDMNGCSYLLINKAKRATLLLLCLATFAFFLSLIFTHFITRGNWTTMLGPILLLGIPLIVFPITELWEYEPWQSNARKHEYHYID